jgi:hypothetical protein
MDWNVFFSTISQTSGAIVGIFSAFLITKIVSNQTTHGQKLSQTSESLALSKKLANETSIRYFDWYGKRKAEDAIEKIQEDYEKTKEIKSPEEYYKTVYFSPFESRSDSLEIIKNQISLIEAEEKAEKERIRKQLAALGPGRRFITPMRTTIPRLSNFGLIDKLNDERDLIDDLYVRIQHQADINKNLLTDLTSESESSNLISVSILSVILLFFAGVIYPLSFLPLDPNVQISLSLSAFWDILFSLKGVLLTLISAIFGGLMLVFYLANRNLSYKPEIKAELETYSKATNYSVYFANYEDNKGT